nr:ribonuclease H-like domain-containing protein [Tanacetum cinerariifolium]
MAPIIEDWVSDSEDEYEPNDPHSVSSLIQISEHVKSSGHSVQPVQAPVLAATPKPTMLTKSKPVSVTAARPVSVVVPKIMVTRPRHAHSLNSKSKSTIIRHKTRSQSSKTSNSPPRVTTAKAQVVSAAKGKKGKWDIVPSGDLTCLFAKATIDESNLWHRRLGHVNFKTINKLVNGNLVRGLPTKVFENNNTCVACKKGKQHKASCKAKPVSSINQPLFRLHMDLFGPTFVKRLNKKSYCLVITDDYSRFTWVFFLATKDETSPILKTFITGLENQLSLKVKNRVLVTKPQNKTPYELLHGRTSSIGFMRPFGCHVTILNTLDTLGKFEGKVDEGFLVGYSINSKAFRVFNSRTHIVQETLHVNFLENKPNIIGTGPTWLFDINSLTRTMNYQPVTVGNESNPSVGFQEEFNAKKAGDEATQQYMLFPVWSTGSSNPQNKEGDAAFDGKEHDAEKPGSAVNLSPSSSALSGEQNDITKKKDKGKSHVEYFTGNRDFNADFEDYSEDNSKDLCKSFEKLMKNKFQMSSMGEFTFFLGLQVKQKEDGIFISQDKYVAEILKKFRLTEGKSDSPFDLVAYSDSDYAGASLDRKSVTGGCQFLGCRLISWQCKKQTVVATSSTEAEYVAGASCCAQVLWIHNQMLDYSKSDASEGFNQIIDFLNGSYIEYALSANPTIYVSCIKQFWNTVAIKQSNDITRLQALVDKKKVVVTEAAIRDALHLNDAKGVDCLPNEEIFTALARMGYEKPSTKLTFYKAFFSSHSAMASAVICLSTGRKFNFSKYIFDSLVRNVDSSSKFYMYPRFIHLIIQNQLGDLSTHTTKYIYPALTQKGDTEEQGNNDNAAEEPVTTVSEDDVEDQSIPSPTLPTPPSQQTQEIPSTSQAQSPPPQPQSPTPAQIHGADFPMTQNLEITKLKTRVKKLERANKVKTLKLRRLRKVGTSQRVDTLDDTVMEDVSNQGRMIDELDKDEGVVLINEKEETKEVKDITGDAQVKGRQAEIYQIDMDHAAKVLSMQEDEPEIQEAVKVVTTAKLITKVVAAVSETVNAAAVVPTVTTAPVKVVVPSTRRRRGIVIRDPEEESSANTPTETKSKDKGKCILVEEPKPIKKKQQVKLDEAYARKLQEELNQDIDWEVAMDHVKQKAKENPYVQRYQVMKKRPQTETQARRNMMMYLKNTVGFRLDYFNGMSYDDIPYRRRLNEEAKDVEELKQHLEIVPDEDDDVYIEATPLARKVPVVDYQIVHFNNKPHYKIIRADVKERFSTSKPNNFSDDFLLTTLKAIFGRPDGQDQFEKENLPVVLYLIKAAVFPTSHSGLIKFKASGLLPFCASGIDNDIYSTIDACPNACETWKSIERLKQELATIKEDDEMSKEKEIDKLMALISLSFKKIYKPTNNNLRTSSKTSRDNQDNSPRINRGTGYENQRVVYVAGARENVGIQDDTDDESDDHELEAHYMYIAHIQEVTPDAADNSEPIFDAEPLPKVQNNNDNYNVFAIACEHHVQPESVNDTYLEEQGDTTITIDSLDMSINGETVDHDDDDDDDLAKERDLLASLIETVKCKIDDRKNRNKFLETSNKALVDKLKGEIDDFKAKNKCLESSNNHFKEANNELSKTNQLIFKDLKKFQAELDRYHDVNYASTVAIDCAKAKGDLMSYKMESEKSFNEYTRKINDLNQTILEMKKELFAHQETISIMSQEKEAQIKFYRIREEKELDKVIEICLWCVDSGCSKHMTGNLKLLINFVWKFMGTFCFGTDHVVAILGIIEIEFDIKNTTLNEYLEVGAENLRRLGQEKVQNGCNVDTSREINHDSDVDLEKEEARVEDDDDGDTYDIWDITVKDVELIR